MKKFSFKLEHLLEHRKALEDTATRALAKAVEELQKAQDAVLHIENDIDYCSSERLAAQAENRWNDVISIFDLQKRLHIKLEKAKEYETACNEEVVERRNLLVKCVTDRKAVEKLKEKAYAQYKAEVLSEEQKLLDDITITKHGKEV